MADSNQDELLAILAAHGEKFLQSFPQDTTKLISKKRKRSTPQPLSTAVGEENYDDEWLGIEDDTSGEPRTEIDESEAESETVGTSNVVIFRDPSCSKPSEGNTKTLMKSFMSSNISKLTSDLATSEKNKKSRLDEDEEVTRTNAQNDALLHKLIHTNLLSGSLTTELDLTPAQRRKALQGRVLELTGSAKLGKGEKLVRETERNKASKRVREGITEKQRERGRRELEEAKNLGNYHPTLKRLYEESGSKPSTERRKRGLSMGIGKFSGGFLKLSREDIQKAEGSSLSSRNRGMRGKFRKQS